MLYYTILYYNIIYYTILYYTILYYTIIMNKYVYIYNVFYIERRVVPLSPTTGGGPGWDWTLGGRKGAFKERICFACFTHRTTQ